MLRKFLSKRLMPIKCCKSDHMGMYYFLQYLKKPRCGVDWSTEIFICEQCGAMLLPPRMLSLYFMFDNFWIGWIATYKVAYILKENNVEFIYIIPILACTYFIFMNLIPGLIAFFGTWRKVNLNGQSREEYSNKRKEKIITRKSAWWYIIIKILIALQIVYVAYRLFW